MLRVDRRVQAFLAASRLRFVLLASTTLVLLYNGQFWHESLKAVGGQTLAGMPFLAALGVILITGHTLVLLALPGRRTASLVTAALFPVAATVAYFGNTYGVYFDHAMVRNIFDTDRAEVHDLLRVSFLPYLSVLGALPASIAGRVVLPRQSFRVRLSIAAASLAVTALLGLAFSADLASYLREHKPLRYLINPANLVYGTLSYAFGARASAMPYADIEGPVERLAGALAAKPMLVFLVVGETARGANFELAGYRRATNPRLRRLGNVVYFREVRSCGTSTAVSVPCMFSHLGHDAFDADRARARPNLLDALIRAHVYVEWRDNNTGCKHVCDRVRHIEYPNDLTVGHCVGSHCFDEVMLDGLREQLRVARDDTVVVFHQIGSHGPAYSERYPRQFETFVPACHSSDLGRCGRTAIVNSYDNTILYTDHVLAQQIELLRSLADRFDSLLIYVSDHGESLGENAVYLHAAPYFIAPDEQTHVPFVLWMSEGYLARSKTDVTCVQARAARPASHDDLYHTMLGALGVRNGAYRAENDLLSACRGQW